MARSGSVAARCSSHSSTVIPVRSDAARGGAEDVVAGHAAEEDTVDADAPLADLDRQRACERCERRLGGRVRAERRRVEQHGATVDEHEGPAAPLAHGGHTRLGQVERAVEVDLEDTSPAVRVRLRDRGPVALVVRVLHEVVHPAESHLRRGHERLARVAVGDVGGHGQRLTPEIPDLVGDGREPLPPSRPRSRRPPHGWRSPTRCCVPCPDRRPRRPRPCRHRTRAFHIM